MTDHDEEQDECPRCEGTGELDCPACHGSGEGMRLGSRCTRCHSTGSLPCPDCNPEELPE